MASVALLISLPQDLRDYVTSQVEAQDCGTPSEFFRNLLEQDRERRLARLESQLLQALSEEPIRLPLDSIPDGGLVDFLRSVPDAR